MSSDSHGSHAAADPHAADPHAADPHAAAHAHDEAPVRTIVPPFEKTPWGMILIGIVVTAAVVGLGLVRDWGSALKANPGSRLAPAGQSAPAR